MFRAVCDMQSDRPPAEVGERVKVFFRFYGRNRHKLTTLTPSLHAEDYSPDDNRFDLRPFLYNGEWEAQFASIDRAVAAMGRRAHAVRQQREKEAEDRARVARLHLKKTGGAKL